MNQTQTNGDKLAEIVRHVEETTRMITPEHLAEHDKISKRLHRATRDLERGEDNADEKLIASAKRRIEKARADRQALVVASGILDRFPAPPARIEMITKQPWHGNGLRGVHVHRVEMVLDYVDLFGPQYKTVNVLEDSGGPPATAPFFPRKAPDRMGMAWFAVPEQLKRGDIKVLP